jgi:hypothetical protein
VSRDRGVAAAGGPAADDTLYDVLQVGPRAGPAVIEAAYQALRCAAPHEAAARPATDPRRRRLGEAYLVLGDPRRRALYDLGLRAAATASGHAQPAARPRCCWRCGEPLDLARPYCGTCRWTVCDGCEACGCENPGWRRQLPRRLVRWPFSSVVGLLCATVAVVLAIGIGSLAPGGLPGLPAALTEAIGCLPPAPGASSPVPVLTLERSPAPAAAPAPPPSAPGEPSGWSLMTPFLEAARALVHAR